MKLKEFNPENSGIVRAGLSPRIRVNKKSGLFGINASGCSLMELGNEDFIVIVQDEESPTDWYLEKVKKHGFSVRAKSPETNNGLWFNSCGIAKLIFLSVGFEDNSGTVLIGGTPTKIGDRVLWGLLTNRLLD